MSSDEEPTIDEAPELILEDEATIRTAFDPHISAISLDAKTNNPTDGYKLAMSVSFGSERAELKTSEETAVEFRFEIYAAEVIIEPISCRFDMEFDRDLSILEPVAAISDLSPDDREKSWRVKVKTGELLDSVGLPSAEVEGGIKGRSPNKADAWYTIRFLTDNLIRIESKGTTPLPLDGQLLYNYIGWNVLPQAGCPSGVLARLRVRADWIRLAKPELIGERPSWWSKFVSLFDSAAKEQTYRREAFKVLLTHLVTVGLQEASETRDATLAMDAVLVKPSSDFPQKIQSLSSSINLTTGGKTIAKFLDSKAGQEDSILRAAGVPPERFENLPNPQEIAGKNEEDDIAGEFEEPRAFDLNDQDLSGASLKDTDLTGADLKGKNLSRADLRGAVLRDADLRGAMFDEAYLQGADLRGALLDGTDFRSAKMQDANIAQGIFEGANLAGAKLNAATLTGAEFKNTVLNRTVFEGATMDGVCFYSLRIDSCNFDNTSLEGATFAGIVLQNVSLQNSNLSQTNFVDADLFQSRLSGSNLTDADLTGADLRAARMNETNLKHAVFQNCLMQSADLTEAVNLLVSQLSLATMSVRTILPESIQVSLDPQK